MTLSTRLARDRRAATAIEYSLIAALIAVAAIAALLGLGTGVRNAFNGAAPGMTGRAASKNGADFNRL